LDRLCQRVHPRQRRPRAEAQDGAFSSSARARRTSTARGGRPRRNAVAARSLQAGLRARDDRHALLLGDPSEDRDQERAHRAPRVEPRLAHADDLDAAAISMTISPDRSKAGTAALSFRNTKHVGTERRVVVHDGGGLARRGLRGRHDRSPRTRRGGDGRPSKRDLPEH
jgi:hypothetical protein